MEPLKDCYTFSLKPKIFTIFRSCSSSLVSIGFSDNYNTRTTIIFLKKDYSEIFTKRIFCTRPSVYLSCLPPPPHTMVLYMLYKYQVHVHLQKGKGVQN
jgi:hypothetical protein